MAAQRATFRLFQTGAFGPLRQPTTGLHRHIAQRAYQTTQRRGQTVAKDVNLSGGVASTESAAPQSGFAKFWNNPVGPKTVHFWAPIMKWGVVLIGVSDFARPAEQLSLTQNLALVGTGAIWTRWCFIIKPRNIFLAAVNFFLFIVGSVQCTRIFLHNQAQSNKSLTLEAKEFASEKAEQVKEVVAETVKKA